MKRFLTLLVFTQAVALSSVAFAQDNPYPTSCLDFIVETVYCNDVDSGGGSCHGSLPYVIDAASGDGYYAGQFSTLICTGGTNNCKGNNSPTCPTCPNVSGYVTEVYNPICTEGDGGGGDGGDCDCDDPECGGEECGLLRHAANKNAFHISSQTDFLWASLDRRVRLDLLDLSKLRVTSKPFEDSNISQNHY